MGRRRRCRIGGPCVATATVHTRSSQRTFTLARTIAAALAQGFGNTKRATPFSLSCRFDAHNRLTAGRGALRKFPTFERPQAKLPPFEKRLPAHVPSGPSAPSRNAHPHNHRNLEPITRFVPPEASHLGRRSFDAVPCRLLPMTMTATRRYH
jgi:hypothetical protein